MIWKNVNDVYIKRIHAWIVRAVNVAVFGQQMIRKKNCVTIA